MAQHAPTLPALRDCLLDISQPVSKRTHAAFHCRTLKTADAADIIASALQNRLDSSLMRHELAYILGQMQFPHICPILVSILENETEDILVRHESAEALGAIGEESSLEVLTKFRNHSASEISETCEIAIDLIQWRKANKLKSEGSSLFLSVDPAPPITEKLSIQELRSNLMNAGSSLFERYRAMFSLRDFNSDDSAIALLDGFKDSSALFRHEIAYVLGQMQRPVTVDGLATVLKNTSEHRMVRHEAAEALGAIGGEVVEAILRDFKADGEQVVMESCEVALDTMEYWSSGFT